jgi:hypothetical protein
MISKETHKYAEFVVVIYTVTTALKWLNKVNSLDLQRESLSQDCARQIEDPPRKNFRFHYKRLHPFLTQAKENR